MNNATVKPAGPCSQLCMRTCAPALGGGGAALRHDGLLLAALLLLPGARLHLLRIGPMGRSIVAQPLPLLKRKGSKSHHAAPGICVAHGGRPALGRGLPPCTMSMRPRRCAHRDLRLSFRLALLALACGRGACGPEAPCCWTVGRQRCADTASHMLLGLSGAVPHTRQARQAARAMQQRSRAAGLAFS